MNSLFSSILFKMLWSVGVAVCVVLYACAPIGGPSYATSSKKEADVASQCVLPAIQSKTISGVWKTVPILMAVYQPPSPTPEFDFSQDELVAIAKASEVWNGFYRKSQQIFGVMSVGESGVNRVSTERQNPLCSQASNNGSNTATGISPVVVYKLRKWPYDKSAVALTSFCTLPLDSSSELKDSIPGSKYTGQVIYNAVMELNYENFWNEGQKQPDLASIVTHEMGHLIGLDHSCDTVGKDGFPTCSQLESTGVDSETAQLYEQIKASVVYPTVFFEENGAGKVRTDLSINDQNRANCLYNQKSLGAQPYSAPSSAATPGSNSDSSTSSSPLPKVTTPF